MNYSTDTLLKNCTTLRIGGPAARFYEPESIEQIAQIVLENKDSEAPLLVLGNGSNMLFEDDGYDGWIVHIGPKLAGIEMLKEAGCVRVMAGTENGDLAQFLADAGLGGYEFASGIPGTVGGAVIMNAGAYDGEICDVIERAGYIDENGQLQIREKDDLDLSYRHSWFTDHPGIVVFADFRFQPDDPAAIHSKIDELHEKRYSKQPMDKASAGSTFKRPANSFASKLIHESGLQGLRVGDAMVSTKHAGFLINDGSATCAEFLELVRQVQRRVKADSGIDLEMEVRFIPKSGTK